MSGLGSLRYYGGLFSEMPDGSLVVGAAREDRKAKTLVVALHRVDSSCHAVQTFGTNGVVTLSIPAKTGPYGYFDASVDVISADPSGGLLIGGNVGRHELVGRLLGRGQLDRSFGRGGWARLDPHDPVSPDLGPPAPLVTAFAFAAPGRIVLGGNDQGAHCCAQDFVSELTSGGTPVKGFGDGGSIIVPKMSGSYTTQLAPNADGSVYVYVEYEQSGSSSPKVILVRPDGSLDRRFDAVIAQWLYRVWPSGSRFTPTLVPGSGGRFTLVAGLDKNFPPFGTHELSSGIAVRVARSGGIERRTSFATSNVEFDNPVAIRLPSGEIVAAAPVYGSSNVDSVLLRSFSPNGTKVESQRIARSEIPPRSHLVGLVPATGGAWLAIANTEKFELIPVR